MPSSDLVKDFMKRTDDRFERFEVKMDRQFWIGVSVIVLLAGPKAWELIPKIMDIAVAFAGGK